MELGNYKLLFKSKKIIDNMCQHKKLCDVYYCVWFEIRQD